MKILLIMLVVVVGMKVFAHDNETMLRPWDTDTVPLFMGFPVRQA